MEFYAKFFVICLMIQIIETKNTATEKNLNIIERPAKHPIFVIARIQKYSAILRHKNKGYPLLRGGVHSRILSGETIKENGAGDPDAGLNNINEGDNNNNNFETDFDNNQLNKEVTKQSSSASSIPTVTTIESTIISSEIDNKIDNTDDVSTTIVTIDNNESNTIIPVVTTLSTTSIMTDKSATTTEKYDDITTTLDLTTNNISTISTDKNEETLTSHPATTELIATTETESVIIQNITKGLTNITKEISKTTVSTTSENTTKITEEIPTVSVTTSSDSTTDNIDEVPTTTVSTSSENTTKITEEIPTVSVTTSSDSTTYKTDELPTTTVQMSSESTTPGTEEIPTTTISTTSSKTTTNSIKTEKPPVSSTKTGVSEAEKCSCKKNTDTDKEEIPKVLLNFKPPVTSLSHDEKHYRLADYIIKFVFKHYPEYHIPLLAKVLANGTTHQAFSGMVMEFQQPNNYDILVTDAYSQVNDGSLRKAEQYPSLYQCSKAIRYCSVNPKFCQYQEGDYDTNIIITVPHGGLYKPDNLKERTVGCYDNGKCVYTHDCEQYGGIKDSKRCAVETRPNTLSKKMALLLADSLKNITGQRPHIIMMELHRSVIDVDALQEEGAFNDDDIKSTWYDFHNFISIAKQKIKNRGILLDIHTHLHKHGLVELGYAVKKSQLERDEVDTNESSIKSLAEYVKVPFESILRGENSFGKLLQNRNIEAFPSPTFKKPTNIEYKAKQTIVRLYGSMYGGQIDAIRISSPKKYYIKRQSKEFITLLSSAVKEFMDLNYVKK